MEQSPSVRGMLSLPMPPGLIRQYAARMEEAASTLPNKPFLDGDRDMSKSSESGSARQLPASPLSGKT